MLRGVGLFIMNHAELEETFALVIATLQGGGDFESRVVKAMESLTFGQKLAALQKEWLQFSQRAPSIPMQAQTMLQKWHALAEDLNHHRNALIHGLVRHTESGTTHHHFRSGITIEITDSNLKQWASRCVELYIDLHKLFLSLEQSGILAVRHVSN